MKPEGTLVILTPGFASSEADSTCLPLQQSLVRILCETYPQLRVVVLSFHYPFRCGSYAWHEASVESFNGRNRGGLRSHLTRQKIWRRLLQLQRKEKLVGLLSFWYGECALLGHRFAKRYGLKHFCWLLGQDARRFNKHAVRHPLPAGELIALSHFLQDEMERNFSIRPLRVIPAALHPQHLPLSKVERDIDVLAAGSLIPLKQFDQFIAVVAALCKELPSLRCVLIGKGPERKRLETLIAQYGLSNHVQLTGELPHGEVVAHMQRAKVFLHPSAYEGFGVVCLEALYAGTQVVSFVQPMRQAIQGWHVVHTTAEMAQTAKTILQAPTTVYESRLPFSMQDTVQALMNLYVEPAVTLKHSQVGTSLNVEHANA